MKQKGFTLLEILLVIAAIGILAAIVIVAINPNRQLAQVRDTTRQNDINSIQKALEQYLIDTGSYPTEIDLGFQQICAQGQTCSGIDLETLLVPTYLASIPQDPSLIGTESGYTVGLNPDNNRVAVSTLNAEETDSEELAINSYNSLDAGLYAYYSFDQTSGSTLIDDTGNGNTGSMSLTNPFSVDVPTELSSVSTGSFYFDNTDDRIIMDTVLYQYPMTISTWIKPEATPGNFHICIWGADVNAGDGFGDQNESNFGYGYRGGPLVHNVEAFMRVGGESTSLNEAGELTQSVWQHITYVIDEDTIKVFINGVETASSSFSSGFTPDFSGYQFMRLGAPGTLVRECHAYLDDLRFYSRELYPNKIQRLSNGQIL